MLSWLSDNLWTLLISLFLLFLLLLALRKILRDRRKGKCSCGGSCGFCPREADCCRSGGPEKLSGSVKHTKRKES